ncbi:hypothetical protein LH373_13920, partial [Staphylococcus argenteus]|nr:hypothetical protein [Staphylococcus argenteus]
KINVPTSESIVNAICTPPFCTEVQHLLYISIIKYKRAIMINKTPLIMLVKIKYISQKSYLPIGRYAIAIWII